MEQKKKNMLTAIRFWAISEGMEETETDTFDLLFKKEDKVYGFITEFDRNKPELKMLIEAVISDSDHLYIVTDDNGKRRELIKTIPKRCGILCYGNSFGLGNVYQVLKESEPKKRKKT